MAEGGETVWPCMGTLGDHNGMAVARMCRKAFDGGARWHNRTKTVMVSGEARWKPTGPATQAPSDPNWHTSNRYAWTLDNLWDATNDACMGKVDGAVLTTPQKESAVVFHHDLLNGAGGDPLAWHTGCSVLRGEKVVADPRASLHTPVPRVLTPCFDTNSLSVIATCAYPSLLVSFSGPCRSSRSYLQRRAALVDTSRSTARQARALSHR